MTFYKFFNNKNFFSLNFKETESRLRNEVEKIKKKMAVTIHELEMSLDAANKNNVQLQVTITAKLVRIFVAYVFCSFPSLSHTRAHFK